MPQDHPKNPPKDSQLRNEPLASTIDEAEWAWIKPHVQRDAVIIVGQNLNLLDVAKEVAANNAQLIQKWIQKGFLAKPNQEQIKEWDTSPTKRFTSIVVQPYVLIQEILLH